MCSWGENTRGQDMVVILRQHRNCFLQHDHAVVELLVDKVHRAAGDGNPIIEGLLLCVHDRERRAAGKDGC